MTNPTSSARFTAEEDFVLKFGGRCRDCADVGPVCPNSGLPCNRIEARKAIQHTMAALRYGVENGFLPALALAAKEAGPGGKTLADWSRLPKDLYVVEAVEIAPDIIYDVKLCSVPMITVPEVRYTLAASPPPKPDAGERETAERIWCLRMPDGSYSVFDSEADARAEEDIAGPTARMFIPAPAGDRQTALQIAHLIALATGNTEAADAVMLVAPDAIASALSLARQTTGEAAAKVANNTAFRLWGAEAETKLVNLCQQIASEIRALDTQEKATDLPAVGPEVLSP